MTSGKTGRFEAAGGEGLPLFDVLRTAGALPSASQEEIDVAVVAAGLETAKSRGVLPVDPELAPPEGQLGVPDTGGNLRIRGGATK